MNFTNKPKNTTIDLDKLKPSDLEYYCPTRYIDKPVCDALKIPFNPAVAEEMETHQRMYFVVKTNREYDVKSGVLFEAWLLHYGLIDEIEEARPYKEPSAKARACKDHFIDLCVKMRQQKNKIKNN